MGCSEVQNWSAYEMASLPDYGREEAESGKGRLQTARSPGPSMAENSVAGEPGAIKFGLRFISRQLGAGY